MKRRDFLKLAAIAGFTPSTLFAARTYQVPVLMYHDINEDKKDEYSVSPIVFEHQMKWLKFKGFNAIPITEIHNAKEKDIVITFDDGYKSFKEYAFPILQDFNWHSTVNLVGEWIGKQIPDIKLRPALSKEEIQELYTTELVGFGCHTYGLHSLKRNVTHMNEKQIRSDLLKFQAMYFDMLNAHCQVLAWPFGKYTEASVNAATETGFNYLLTSHYGRYRLNPHRIERLAVIKGRDFMRMMDV